MPTLLESTSLINRHESADLGKTRAVLLIALQAAIDQDEAAAALVEQTRTRLDDLRKVSMESLPDSDAEIRDHLVNVQVAGVRESKAQRTRQDTQAAVAAARNALEVDFLRDEQAYRDRVAERARLLTEAADRFAKLSSQLVDLLGAAHRLHAEAEAIKSGNAAAALRPEALAVRVELVDDKGKKLLSLASNAPFAGEA